jgi:hypothetical protein
VTKVKSKPVTISATVLFNNAGYQAPQRLSYTSSGKAGSTKPRK